MPTKPGFKTKEDVKKEKSELEGKTPFDLDKVYDTSTYNGRFKMQLNSVNPLMFFISQKQIQEAKEELFKYKVRLEAARNMDS